VETRGKVSWKYGYLEACALLPTGVDALSSIWLLGPNGVTEWPRSGEIDVVEVSGSDPATVHTNIHGVDSRGKHWETGWVGPNKSYTHPAGSLSDDYHSYGLDWTTDELRFYFDGRLVRSAKRDDIPVWLFDKDFYLILNLAIIPLDGGGPPADHEFPQEMKVDYVRRYSAPPTTEGAGPRNSSCRGR
jgi:beta-glucanase (GH16 family)